MQSAELEPIRESLLNWFQNYQRDLPWRRNRDPYRVWVSEIMLQQTRVAAVIPYYEKFLARFPDIESLASAPEEELLRLWSGLGYYSRARNLHKAARQIVLKRDGKFPHTRDELLALAGIGEYTAAAILSIAFDEKHAVLDGNVARVLARLGAVRGDLRTPQRWAELQTMAERLLARQCAGRWNEAMMELGATVCTPRSPQCLLCPVNQFCQARKLGIAESLPEKRKKRTVVPVQLVSLVLLDKKSNTLLFPPPGKLGKSEADDHVPSLLARLWHFPTVSASGGIEEALAGLVHRGLHLKSAKSTEPLPAVRHTVTYRNISVSPFVLRLSRLPRVSGAKCLALDEVSALPISNLTRKVAHRALQHLSSAQSPR